MPSSTRHVSEQFFSLEDLRNLGSTLGGRVPVLKGKVWAGDERQHSWTVECEDFESFCSSIRALGDSVLYLALDESILDEDAIHVIQEDLYHFADEDNLSNELVHKAVSALRSHDGELFAVFAYAFLKNGQVIFVRAQTELAQYVFHPDRLLSSDGLSSVRKLRTLVEN